MAKRRVKPTEPLQGPTTARLAHNDTHRMGMAYRVVPMLDTLLRTKQINHAQYDALNYYRDQASRAEDDMAQEGTLSPSRIMGGSGGACEGKIPAILLGTSAIQETTRIEKALGSLRELTRRVCVDDWSLTRWAIERTGGKEKFERGKVVAIVPRDAGAIVEAREQLRKAAANITR